MEGGEKEERLLSCWRRKEQPVRVEKWWLSHLQEHQARSTVQQGEGSTVRRYYLRIPEQFLPLV
ncbi:hypothetical protein Syun_020859 [Stephania yunnanensis]|uniref:Uncharacterized protein n=1 Tax=Stephania yunnanensis TaxID=152371 RepID=A0AAP0IGJ1_9MAGN